tara:strand:+ start:1469 stop:2434 length:966 start_codon:yes stop_codon:yes gene_type:complete
MEQIVEESVTSKEDKRLAKLLCDGDPDTRKSFLKIHDKRLFVIASKICGESFELDFSEKIKPKKTLHEGDEKSYDEIINTYQWLIHQLQIKSCLYKARAKFENYIFNVLNSKWVRKDWLKWKTGVTGYVPKEIKKLGSTHTDVFKLLRQKKDERTIGEKLGIHPEAIDNYIKDIYDSLIKSDQLDLVKDYKISSINILHDGEEVSFEPADTGISTEQQTLLSIQMEQIDNIITSIFSLSQQKIAIAYWGHKFSADLLYKGLKKDAPGILEKSNIESVDDVYKFVTNFINDFHKEIKNYPDYKEITNKGARTIIENYFLIKK